MTKKENANECYRYIYVKDLPKFLFIHESSSFPSYYIDIWHLNLNILWENVKAINPAKIISLNPLLIFHKPLCYLRSSSYIYDENSQKDRIVLSFSSVLYHTLSNLFRDADLSPSCKHVIKSKINIYNILSFNL